MPRQGGEVRCRGPPSPCGSPRPSPPLTRRRCAPLPPAAAPPPQLRHRRPPPPPSRSAAATPPLRRRYPSPRVMVRPAAGRIGDSEWTGLVMVCPAAGWTITPRACRPAASGHSGRLPGVRLPARRLATAAALLGRGWMVLYYWPGDGDGWVTVCGMVVRCSRTQPERFSHLVRYGARAARAPR